MRILFLLPAFLFVISNSYGQRNPESEIKSPEETFDCFIFLLAQNEVSLKKNFPYKEIIVVDERPDTSKCGYWLPHIKARMAKLCIKNGLRQNVSAFFNQHLKDNFDPTGNSLVAYIKKCWISTYDSSKIFYKVSSKVEFYVKTDSFYYPIYRFDNVAFHERNSKMDPSKILEEIFVASIQKLYSRYTITDKSKKLSSSQIDSFNNQLKTSSVLSKLKFQRGVYMNFSHFKNDQPLYHNFKFAMDGKTDIVFVEGKNIKDSAIIDAWGFSDGENIFIRLQKNYFPLFRCGNTFDLYGFKKITETRFYPAPGSLNYPYATPAEATVAIGIQALLTSIKNTSKDFKPYQLDMDTGELY